MDMTLLNQTSTNTSCHTKSSMEAYTNPAMYSLFFVVGFPANCLSLYLAWILMKNGNNMAVYLFCLSISDLLYIISLPAWIELSLQRSLGGLCSVIAVVMHNSFYFGSGLLCCISADRYLAVVYPLHFTWVREVRTAVLVTLAVWILELVLHIVLLDHIGALKAFSSRNLCVERMPMTKEDANHALTRIFLGFLVPVFIMTFCFQQIMKSLRQSSSIQAEERKKVGTLLFFLLLTYLVSFVPYQTVMLIRAILEPEDCVWAIRLRDPYLLTVATTTINSTMDPIIYCLISESAKREIRNALKRGSGVLMRKRCKDNSTVIQSVS